MTDSDLLRSLIKHMVDNAAHGYTEGSELYTVYNKEAKDLEIVSADMIIKRLEEQLAAANARITELEDALADMVTAPVSLPLLKERILEAFANALSETGTPGYACGILSKELDELNN